MTPAEARADLAAAFKAMPVPVSAPVYPRQTSRVAPPCVVLEPADPWIQTSPDTPYGQAEFRYIAQVIAPSGTVEHVADMLDALVEEVISSALSAPGEWHLESVSRPDYIPLNGQSYLSADVELSAPFIL